MKTRLLPASLLIISSVAALCLAPVLYAQSKPAVGKTPYALEIVDGKFIHKGKEQPATLVNVVDALREMFPEFNIAMVPDLAHVKVMDLKFRPADGGSTALEEVLTALRVATGNRFAWRTGAASTNQSFLDPNTGWAPSIAGGSPDLTRLYMLSLSMDESAPQSKRAVEVFNLHGYLEQLGPNSDVERNLEQLKEMIAKALVALNPDGSGGSDEPELQFHPGANLLIVIGSPEAVELARKIVTALPYYGGPGTGYPAFPGLEPGGGGGGGQMRYGLGIPTVPPAPAQPAVPMQPAAPAVPPR